MNPTLAQPIPKDLREQMIKRMQSATDEDLVFAYEVMLFAEKERVWKEIQKEADAEAAAGLHDLLPDLIRQYRARKKKPA